MGRARNRERTITRADDPNYTDTGVENTEEIQAVFQERGMSESDAANRARDAKQRMEKSKHTGKRLSSEPGRKGATAKKKGAAQKGSAARKGGTSQKGNTARKGGTSQKNATKNTRGTGKKTATRKTPPVRSAEEERGETFSERSTEYSPADPYRDTKVSER